MKIVDLTPHPPCTIVTQSADEDGDGGGDGDGDGDGAGLLYVSKSNTECAMMAPLIFPQYTTSASTKLVWSSSIQRSNSVMVLHACDQCSDDAEAHDNSLNRRSEWKP